MKIVKYMRKTALLISFIVLLISTNNIAAAQIAQPSWAQNAVIYQVNPRQFSSEGTFAKFSESLMQLKDMGVNVINLTPVQFVGEKNKLGNAGDVYNVREHYSIASNYGNEEDFKKLVAKIHEYGMKIILDWNTSYTSIDHNWVGSKNAWYLKDENGNILSKVERPDIAMLNYDNLELRAEVLNAMKHWVKKMGVDGFRVKDANYAPIDFWKELIQELNYIKPLYFIADINNEVNVKQYSYYAEVFNSINDYSFLNNSTNHSQGIISSVKYVDAINSNYKFYPSYSLRVNSLSEYLYNTQVGTVDELFAKNWQLYAMLSFVLPQSTPLIFNGEENGLTRRLNIYEYDFITSDEKENKERVIFYKAIVGLKKDVPALQNTLSDSSINFLTLNTSMPEQNNVLAFKRMNQNSEAYIFVNFGNKQSKIKIENTKKLSFLKKYSVHNNAKTILKKKTITLPANSYVIYYK